ncbi:MAG TPA: DUF433 domain-containing protein [Ignavibacteria bacterium]|nr:DUF433 domain-containing protein [Ignavibacteria bacterium]
MNKQSPINIDPEIMSGAPVFRGTRVTIQTLFDLLENGKSLDDFLKIYDWIPKEQAIRVLELAKKTFSDEKMLELIDENIA